MIKHKWIGAVAVLLMTAAALTLGFVYLHPSTVASLADSQEPGYAAEMEKAQILDIQIIADEEEWASMLQNATAEEYIPATVVINGSKVENVGIRPKGNSSLSTVAQDDTTDRYSFKIEFDRYIAGQTWLGLDKLVVNNLQGDATYMKEYLSYDIMAAVGVASPLYAFADISVNGRAWGFYLAVEALEDGYVRRVYGKDHGRLYKPESMGMRGNGQMNDFIERMQEGAQGQARMPQGLPGQDEGMQEHAPPAGNGGQIPGLEGEGNGGGFGGGMGGMASGGVSLQYVDDEESSYSAIFDNSVFSSTQSDHARVIQALKKLSAGEDLENTVDVEAVLKYFAAHTVVVNMDSYVSSMAHNYYLYEKDGKLAILPWDYNLAFGGFQSSGASGVVNFPIDTPVSGVSLEDRPLLGKLLEVPEYLEQYHAYLREIVNGYFRSGVFEQTVDSLHTLIATRVQNDPSAFYGYAAYEAAVAELKELGFLRAQSIEGQLDGTIPATSEGQKADGSALIDASGIDLSSLGNQGGGGFGMPGGGNMESMRQAMEILRSAGEDGLTEETLASLRDLGLTDEQIEEMHSMSQAGLGARQPGARGGMPMAMAQSGGFPGRGNPSGTGGEEPAAASGYDSQAWLVLGVCFVLLAGGILWVMLSKRRRGA